MGESKRATLRSSFAKDSGRTLTATSRPSFVSRARHTSPCTLAASTNALDDFAESSTCVEGHALVIRRNESLELFEPVRHQLHPCRWWRYVDADHEETPVFRYVEASLPEPILHSVFAMSMGLREQPQPVSGAPAEAPSAHRP